MHTPVGQGQGTQCPPTGRLRSQSGIHPQVDRHLGSGRQRRLFPATLLELPVDDRGCVHGDVPVLEEVLGNARLLEAPLPSRLA